MTPVIIQERANGFLHLRPHAAPTPIFWIIFPPPTLHRFRGAIDTCIARSSDESPGAGHRYEANGGTEEVPDIPVERCQDAECYGRSAEGEGGD